VAKTDTKKTLIEAGTNFIIENGYNHTGLNEVLAAAGVPKGSFYYYFNSKEDFGLEVIANFEQNLKASLKFYLENKSDDPLTRLERYFQANIATLVELQCRQGCLVGNLGQELSDQNETFRLRLKQVMDEWAASLALCLSEAKANGQLPQERDPQALAEFCLNSWQGAILRMKIAKNRAPLDNFMQLMFEVIFRK
jgi:TetR/AcrR family transcriptional repressor of nem operon